MPDDRSIQASRLQVLIVGGSLGGLATAIALRSQGHVVTIYEQAGFNDTRGAGITLFPNALSALRDLDVELSTIRASKVKQITRTNLDEGCEAPKTVNVKLDESSWMWHNATYHDILIALRQKLNDPKSPGPKAEVRTCAQVVKVDPSHGVIFFADGSQAHGHIIIGADGVHSVCRPYIPQGNNQRFRIQRGVFRALIPRETLLADPKTSKFVEQLGHAICYNLEERSLLVFPASEHENICVKLLYDDHKGFKSLCKDWREPSSRTKMLRIAAGLPEECIALLEKIEAQNLQDQPIWDMDPLSNFHSHRLVLMGDAAHPMPPYCGQRVAMAIEDAIALGTVLDPEVRLEELEERFKLYSTTRSTRAAAVQQFVRGLSELDMWGGTSGFDATAFRTYILGHNERDHMTQALSYWKMQKSLQQDISKVASNVTKPTNRTPDNTPQPKIAPVRRKSWFSKFLPSKQRPIVALVGT
ncbi:hypothetical protein, variant 1 [Exophiala mesophila]|uniref:FAD-binding domain-containing protein n=1 Tax=Exophiala mesophila TaxID=212818 RepID=A0A0D1ZKD4_EXOME|nr:hypothetical protein, variant 1 [Exophiala mesophila]KIV95047.1 hypothetical protein, variant 1 [Exophiala mesophila]